MATPAGIAKEQALREGGFSDTEIEQWKGDTVRDLTGAGFSTPEIGEYFGIKEPDMAPMKKYFEENLKAYQEGKASPGEASNPALPKAPPNEADDWFEALEAGWKMSVTGLITKGKAPDMILPEHAPMASRIASQIGTLAGDLPAMLAGSFGGRILGQLGGGAIGTAVPGIGNAAGAAFGGQVGSNAGAFALPAAIRETLMQHYEKGDIKDFGDFWERSSAVFWEASKAGFVGGLTGVAGVAAKGVLGPVASGTARALAQTGAEIATMVTVGKAIEGEVPHAQDFLDAAILIGGIHTAARITGGAADQAAGKLRNVYAKTGLKPTEVLELAKKDPTIQQDLLASNGEIPKALEKLSEKPIAKPETPGHALEASIEAAKELEPKAAPEAKGERPEAVDKILSQVGEKTKAESKGYSSRQFYQEFVDRLDPISEAVKVLKKDPSELPADQNPYLLSRMANDYRAKAKHVIENGTIDFKTLEKNGKSFQEIIEPHSKELEHLEAYLISKRALEVEGRGLKSGFDVEAAKEVVQTGKGKFEKAAGELVEYQNRVMGYLKDSGVVSAKSFDSMVEAGKAYVPFSRIMEASEGGGKKGKSSSLKAFKGSDLKIQSPFISMLENTEAIFKLAEKNRAIDSLVRLASEEGSGKVIEKVPGKLKPVEVKADEFHRAIQDQFGLDLDTEAFTVFRGQAKDLGPNEFEVFRNGKREVYRVSEDAPVGLAEAIKGLDGDPAATNILIKLARGITAVKKLGIALTPEFIIKNFIRDQTTAGVFSKGGGLPLSGMIGAMGDLIKKTDTYYDWLKSGGASGTFLELNQNYLETDIFKLNKETGFMDKTWNLVKTPVQMIQVAAHLTEQATRLAEFKKVSGGASSGTKVFEGGYAAREVTVDFSRMGAKVSAINAITAFMNVSVQGLDRTVRAIKEDPKGTAARAAFYITTPSVLLWWAQKDDERWKNTPRWQKDTHWIVLTDDWQKAKPGDGDLLPEYLKRTRNGNLEINKGNVYRIPKPQELGILFGSLPERVLEKFFTDHPNAMKEFDETLLNLVTPAFIPDAVAPAVEQHFNRSLFTDGPIVPHSLEGVLPEYQYSEHTSESAKILSRFIGAVPAVKDLGKGNLTLSSPMIVENYVRSWTGTLGSYALQAADQLLVKSGVVPDPVKPSDTLSDIPFVKAFVVRHPSANAQPIRDFYDRNEKSETVMNTIKELAGRGDFKNMEKVMFLKENQAYLAQLKGIKEALGNQSKIVRDVYANPELNRDEKRQLIDGVYYLMIEEATLGNKLLMDLEKNLNE
jgi:hypothetical protein